MISDSEAARLKARRGMTASAMWAAGYRVTAGGTDAVSVTMLEMLGGSSRIRTCAHGSGGRQPHLANFVRSTCLYSVAVAPRRQAHSAYIPDHGRGSPSDRPLMSAGHIPQLARIVRAFLLTMLHHIACGGHEDVRVVLHVANSEVAAVAQEAAYLPAFVIVVNSPSAPGARFGGPADRAPAALPREKPVVVGLRDAV
jgi:hypothetical protein